MITTLKTNVGLMLVHHLQLWPNIKVTLDQHIRVLLTRCRGQSQGFLTTSDWTTCPRSSF